MAMYEIDQAWNSYFDTLDPGERLELLDILAGRDDGIGKFCLTLWQERYTDPKQPDRKVDTWLFKFVYLPGLFKRRKFLGKGAMRKETEGTLKELHLDAPDSLSEMEQAVLYHEFRNAARRYLSTCKGSNYASRLLGLKKASDQEKLDRACEDIWMVSRGIARAAGMEENLKLWCDALYAELLIYDPNSYRHYSDMEEDFKK